MLASLRKLVREEERELVMALANQAALALELTRLAEEARQSALLEERNQLACEIHDTLAQGFTGVLMQLQAATLFLTTDSERTQIHMTRAQNLARQGLAAARQSVWALSQAGAEYSALDQMLTQVVQRMTAETAVQIKVYLEGTPYTNLNGVQGR